MGPKGKVRMRGGSPAGDRREGSRSGASRVDRLDSMSYMLKSARAEVVSYPSAEGLKSLKWGGWSLSFFSKEE